MLHRKEKLKTFLNSDWLVILIAVGSKRWSSERDDCYEMSSASVSSLPRTCAATPFQSPLPWPDPGLGQHQELFHIWHPESQFPTAWANIFCLSGLYSPIHACWSWFRLKSTKMSTQPFISFHRKPSYLNMSLHLRSLLKMLCGCVAQSRPTLCSPMDCSLPGSSVRGIPWLTLLSSLRPHSSSPSSHVRKLHSSPSSYSPKARVSFETKVKYAAEFQESRQENISVRDETKVMKQQGILRKRIWERSH